MCSDEHSQVKQPSPSEDEIGRSVGALALRAETAYLRTNSLSAQAAISVITTKLEQSMPDIKTHTSPAAWEYAQYHIYTLLRTWARHGVPESVRKNPLVDAALKSAQLVRPRLTESTPTTQLIHPQPTEDARQSPTTSSVQQLENLISAQPAEDSLLLSPNNRLSLSMSMLHQRSARNVRKAVCIYQSNPNA